MKVFGIVGWKNSGKTVLIERLIREFSARKLQISTIKHAHHSFDIDHKGRDSYRHRAAGATEVMLFSSSRWALMHETQNNDSVSLAQLVQKMHKVDLVLIEGFKTAPHPKVECYRHGNNKPILAKSDLTITLLASDVRLSMPHITCVPLDDTAIIADFILKKLHML